MFFPLVENLPILLAYLEAGVYIPFCCKRFKRLFDVETKVCTIFLNCGFFSLEISTLDKFKSSLVVIVQAPFLSTIII